MPAVIEVILEMEIAQSGHVAKSGHNHVILWCSASTDTKLSWIEFLCKVHFHSLVIGSLLDFQYDPVTNVMKVIKRKENTTQ